jgi:MoxR-like ATPase
MSEPVADILKRLRTNIESVVFGKTDVIKMTLVALLSRDHVLLEDVPGVGKTLIAKALAKSIRGKFTRVQFTPDLLPSDIVGTNVFNSNSGEFKFAEGPIFSNVVLADEINRAPPRTQSALLEAMSEDQASVDGTTHELPKPFFVVATQNPFEFEGTYVLPESQLDRFLLRLGVGYPERNYERNVLTSHGSGEPVDELNAVVSLDEVLRCCEAARNVKYEESVLDYLQDLVAESRANEQLHVGLSTRGALGLYQAGQSLALLEGRDYVIPEDIKSLASPVLAHRIVPKGFSSGVDRGTAEAIVDAILANITVPV